MYKTNIRFLLVSLLLLSCRNVTSDGGERGSAENNQLASSYVCPENEATTCTHDGQTVTQTVHNASGEPLHQVTLTFEATGDGAYRMTRNHDSNLDGEVDSIDMQLVNAQGQTMRSWFDFEGDGTFDGELVTEYSEGEPQLARWETQLSTWPASQAYLYPETGQLCMDHVLCDSSDSRCICDESGSFLFAERGEWNPPYSVVEHRRTVAFDDSENPLAWAVDRGGDGVYEQRLTLDYENGNPSRLSWDMNNDEEEDEAKLMTYDASGNLASVTYTAGQSGEVQWSAAYTQGEDSLTEITFSDISWNDAVHWLTSFAETQEMSDTSTLFFRKGGFGQVDNWSMASFIDNIGHLPPLNGPVKRSEMSDWLLSQDEGAGLEMGGDAHFVILDASTLGHSFLARVMEAREDPASYLTIGDGSLTVGEQEMNLLNYNWRYDTSLGARLFLNRADDLSHYRMIYESDELSMLVYRAEVLEEGLSCTRMALKMDDPIALRMGTAAPGQVVEQDGFFYYEPISVPTIRIFQVVDGVTLTGVAEGAQFVQAMLEIHSLDEPEAGAQVHNTAIPENSAGRYHYMRSATVSSSGQFQIDIPYPTGSHVGQFQTGTELHLFALQSNQGTASPLSTVQITEEQVQSGGEIEITSPSE